MSNIIQPGYGPGAYGVPARAQRARRSGTQSFLDIAARARKGVPSTPEDAVPDRDAYLEHLKRKYGQVTIESVGKDQESLEKAGRRMSGHDVVIAPNILEDMAGDWKTAAYYEQKIDYFFHTVIPQGNAICAAKGLVFEPCGVVVHEDGTVTYICGCSDSPERVAEVNRINRERDAKRAEQRKQYQEQSAAAARQRRATWERTAKAEALGESFSSIGDLLKSRMGSTPAITPEVTGEENMFFFRR